MSPEENLSVQDVLGPAGSPPTFSWKGAKYNLGFLDQAAKARFEELIVEAETGATKALKGVLSATDFADAVSRLGRLIDRREYRTGGSLWRKYVAGEEAPRGLVLHVLALFRGAHPDMTEDAVKEMFEDSDFLLMAASRAVPDFFEHVVAGMKGDPAAMRVKIDEATREFRERIRSRD